MFIYIDESDARPLYMQIVNQVKEQIRNGELKPGDELPSVRELGNNLGINLHTVHHAYRQLRDQGVINFGLGRRARVARRRESTASREEIESVLLKQVRELITEAYHMGLTPDDLRELVNQQIDLQKEWR